MSTLAQRFWKYVSPEPNSGCWLWTGAMHDRGYGRIGLGGKYGGSALAHRISYELNVGPIPPAMSIDHLCRTRACVNPDHLEPVTTKENCRRGEAGRVNGARQLAKTACPQGHPYSGDNLYIMPNGRRACKECRRAAVRRNYHKEA
jgi:hypothetical protein